MAEDRKKKSGGAKTSRSETVTVRLNPKTRYLAELCARVQRRTLSSFIEAAVDEVFKLVVLDDRRSIADAASILWHNDPGERLRVLNLMYPGLLNHEEKRLVNLINRVMNELGLFDAGVTGHTQRDFVNAHWDLFTKAAEEGLEQTVIEAFQQNPPTVASIARQISEHKKKVEELELLKAELEAAEKNG